MLHRAMIDRITGRLPPDEVGAVGWLILGIIIGAILVIWAIVSLVVPGD